MGHFATLAHGDINALIDALDVPDLSAAELQAAISNLAQKIRALQRNVQDRSDTLQHHSLIGPAKVQAYADTNGIPPKQPLATKDLP